MAFNAQGTGEKNCLAPSTGRLLNPTVAKISSENELMSLTNPEKKCLNNNEELRMPVRRPNRGSALKQVLAAFVANIGTINTGLMFGFSAVAIPQLNHPNSTISINSDEASWIASLSSVTTPMGCLLGGYLMDQLGRRMTLILLEFPLVLGWLIISFASNLWMIYGGRLLVGLGSGMVTAPSRVYTGEVTQPHLRGMLAALASLGVSLGVLIEYYLGSTLSWSMLSGINASIPVLAVFLMFLMPETPTWLLSRGRLEEARNSMCRVRGDECNVTEELDDLVRFTSKNHVTKLSIQETFAALKHPSALKPFAIISMYFFMYQWSGVNTITFYAVEIFKDSGSDMDSYSATVVLGWVRLVGTILACVLLRMCGRRPLTFVSAFGCITTILGLGTYMYFGEQWKEAGEPLVARWIPTACIMLFIAFCTIGFLVVPWVMIGEVYPTRVRGILGGMTTCVAHLFVFSVVKTYPYLRDSLKIYGVFWLYGCIPVVGTIFLYFFLPETKGRTLEEIEDYFCGRTKTLCKKQLVNEQEKKLALSP